MSGLVAAARRLVSTGRGRLAVLAVVAVLGVIVAAVVGFGGDDVATAPSAPTSTTTSTTVAPPPTTPTTASVPMDGMNFLPEDPNAPGVPAPLNGLPFDPAVLARPAIAVKVDNLDTASETARPQSGLAQADVVVEQLVEGGITRFVAVLHSTSAPEVGPVRSARTTDIDLVPMFGRALFAYSGGNGGVLSQVRASGNFVDGGGSGAPVYHRVAGRRAPHNLYLRPDELWARLDGGATPPPLAPFAPGPPAGGEPVKGVNLAWVGRASAPVAWTWHAAAARWVRHQRGTVHVTEDGYTIGPRNVVLMFVEYRPSEADARSPEAVTVGTGEAWVLVGGRLVRGSWHRPEATAPLALRDSSGAPIALNPGRTWIELANPGSANVDA